MNNENGFSVQYIGNKELLVSYRKENGEEMKLFGTYKNDNSEDYKSYVISQLKDKIKTSKFYTEVK